MSQADPLFSCAGKKAGKPCTDAGAILLRLAILNLNGYFCDSCAASLLKDGLAIEEKDSRHGTGVPHQGHASPATTPDSHSRGDAVG